MNFSVSENRSGKKWELSQLVTCAGHSYISHFCWPTSLLLGAPGLYWGPNAAKKEGEKNSSVSRSVVFELHSFSFSERRKHV